MKNLNVTITDDADGKLDQIMVDKRFKNRADAVDWIIKEVFKQMQEKEARDKTVELGVKGELLRNE